MFTVKTSICILVLFMAVSMVLCGGWNVTADVAEDSPRGRGHFWVVVEGTNRRQGILLTGRTPVNFTSNDHLSFGNHTVLYKPDAVKQVGLKYQRLPTAKEFPEKARFSKVTLMPTKTDKMDFCPPNGKSLEVGDDWVDFVPCK